MYLNKNEHNTVVGMTRHGKSYFVKDQLSKIKIGAIYFNTKREIEDLDNFFNIDASVDIDNLIDKLAKGYKFNFVANKNFEDAEVELSSLIDVLIDDKTIKQNNSIFFAIDEVQLFGKRGQKALKKLATIGLSTGINGVFISQRLKNIDNDIMTQSSTNIFFKTRFEENYYKRYGLDATKIKKQIGDDKYKFVCINPESFQTVEKI